MPAYTCRYKVPRKSDRRRVWNTPKISQTGSGHKEQITLIKRKKIWQDLWNITLNCKIKENSDKLKKIWLQLFQKHSRYNILKLRNPTPCLFQQKISLPVHVRLNRFYCIPRSVFKIVTLCRTTVARLPDILPCLPARTIIRYSKHNGNSEYYREELTARCFYSETLTKRHSICNLIENK